MRYWRYVLLIILFALLVTSCGSTGGSSAANVQVAKLPEAVQQPAPTGTAGLPVTPATAVPTTSPIPQKDVAATCPVTQPQNPVFSPPSPYPAEAPYEDEFWYGTEALWTMLGEEGTWRQLPHDGKGYGQKVFWWRKGYNGEAEPEPKLTVTGRRLDAEAPPLEAWRATNAYHADFKWAMLTGVGIPTHGCWEITGRYGEDELSFVVWVAR